MTPPRHFLTLMDLSASELRALIHRASALKAQRRAGDSQRSLDGKILAMIFTKASTLASLLKRALPNSAVARYFSLAQTRSSVAANPSRTAPASFLRWLTWS